MDLELTEELPCDAVMERLNAVLPEGIWILEAWKGTLAFKKLAYANYTVRIPRRKQRGTVRFFLCVCGTAGDPHGKAYQKKGSTKEVDLKPMLEVTGAEALPDALELRLCLPAGSTANLNPMLLLETENRRNRCGLLRRSAGRNCSQKENKNFFEKNTCFFCGNWYDIKLFEICAEFG